MKKVTLLFFTYAHLISSPIHPMHLLGKKRNAQNNPYITSLEEIRSHFDATQSTDLVVFDIDDTLLESPDKTFQKKFEYSPTILPIIKNFYQHARMQRDPIAYLTTMLHLPQQRRLVEPCAADIIHNLQNRHIRVIALSAFAAGHCGTLGHLEEFRNRELLRNGIDLSKNFAVQELALEETPEPPTDSGHILFYKGIVCSGSTPKGVVLQKFLQKIELRPSKILFIDDTFPNLFSVHEAMDSISIPALLAHYCATIEGRPNDTIDPKVVSAQLAYMQEHGEYVSYDEVRQALNIPLRSLL